jgi:hypothetical protein
MSFSLRIGGNNAQTPKTVPFWETGFSGTEERTGWNTAKAVQKIKYWGRNS